MLFKGRRGERRAVTALEELARVEKLRVLAFPDVLAARAAHGFRRLLLRHGLAANWTISTPHISNLLLVQAAARSDESARLTIAKNASRCCNAANRASTLP